jgi:misacylated tRNA(Ala) deacylase
MNPLSSSDSPDASGLSGHGDQPHGADHPPAVAKQEVDPRMHSAEHILTGALIRMIGCGRAFTTHLEKKKSKADYRTARDLTAAEVHQVEAQVNEVIAQNLTVWAESLPRSQAQQVYDLARLPDSAGETVRIVRIGDYDAFPCSGIHVRTTQEIGHFRVISTTWEAGALRVRFKLDAKLSASEPT